MFYDDNFGGGKVIVFFFYYFYLRGGNYLVIVNIWNLVSNVNYFCFYDLYERIVNLWIIVYDYDLDMGIIKVGGGVN